VRSGKDVISGKAIKRGTRVRPLRVCIEHS